MARRATVAAGFAKSCYSEEISEERIAWLASIDLQSASTAMSGRMIAMREMDRRDAVSDVNLPTPAVHSTDGMVCRVPLTGAVLAERIADALLLQVEDAGHAVIFTRQAETAEAPAALASA